MAVHYELGTRPGAEHVVLITLDRPEARNACDLEHFHQLAQAWKRFDADDAAWVAVFTGVGRSYMSGADLKTYVPEITALAKELQAGTATSVQGYSLSDGTDAVLRGSKIYKPIIAAVNGFAMGGGFEVALACDLIVAAENAVFALPEPSVGLAAMAGGLLRLPRTIGMKRAMGMILTARRVSPQEGKELGFVHEVTPPGQALHAARAIANHICTLSPMSIRASKQVAIRGAELSLADALNAQMDFPAVKAMFGSADLIEGPKAFAEKRKPNWTGR